MPTQVSTLYYGCTRLGVHNWVDMHEAEITVEGMRQGVRDSDVFLLVLTARVLSRPYCLLELREALRCGKPVQLLVEEDPRFGHFDEDAWRRARMSNTRGSRFFNDSNTKQMPYSCT